MNDNIKAIGRKAGFTFIEDGVYGQRWYSSKCGLDASEYEKLVRLIVRECANQVDWILAEGGKTQGDLIKEHFGVKE